MEWNKQKIKGLLLVVCGGVAFYCALQRLDAVLAALGWLLGILAPFLLGGALAFILNVPMRAIERHLFPRNRKGAKLRRPLALVQDHREIVPAVEGVLEQGEVVVQHGGDQEGGLPLLSVCLDLVHRRPPFRTAYSWY